MRIAVLVKQIPAPEQLRMEAGRVAREGVDLEVNAYCRRANAKAIELAGDQGEVVVFTMGPPSAEMALREMIACGSTRGVHITDTAFAGADTLATARVLAAAVRQEGPFDLVLAGLNSLDADTGQVPAELAELLGLPFAAGIRDIELDGTRFSARLETDAGHRSVEGELPVVLSTAERLCAPSKAPPEACLDVADDLVSTLGSDDLGLGLHEVGAAGSPTTVGPVRMLTENRTPIRAASVAEAVDLLTELGAFKPAANEAGTVSPPSGDDQNEVWCFFTEPGIGAELLGEAAELAMRMSGSVTAITPAPVPTGLGGLGADRVLAIPHSSEPAEWAEVLARAAIEAQPWALLVEGTRSGRVVASIVAARHGWGLTGDAIGLDVDNADRLLAWKPAFGGRMEAPIISSSPVQMATVRPGILALRQPRSVPDPEPMLLDPPTPARVRTVSTAAAGDDAGELQRAHTIVAVGQGMDPSGYPLIDELRAALGGAVLGSTRKVTDKGWLPRNTQIGVTGHSVAPQLFVAIASSGRFNHTVGIRNASVILAVNSDPDAEIFDQVDVGLVGDWEMIVPALTAELGVRGLAGGGHGL